MGSTPPSDGGLKQARSACVLQTRSTEERLMKILVRLLVAGLVLPAVLRCGEHPAPGTKIVHFAQVDDGVYKGSKPKNDADFRFLESKHVKYILDLNFLPLFAIEEKRKARKYGMVFIRVPMNASPVSPSEKHVNAALRILHDPKFHSIYFHCELGRDRTSLVTALYQMYFHGMSQQDAWKKMKEDGYKDWWGIWGLKSYFEKHPKFEPAEAPNPAARSRSGSLGERVRVP